MRTAIAFFSIAMLLTSCKEGKPDSNEDVEVNSTEMPENQKIEMPTDDNTDPLEPARLLTILDYNGLGNLQMGSNVSLLLKTKLRPLDSVNIVTKETTEGTFKVYSLSRKGKNLIDFHTKNKRISQVDILDRDAVPENMIGPDSKLMDVNMIDSAAKPRGSELESRVTVNIKNVTYELDARHPIDEAIELYPSTAITKVTFKR